ncbi:MAG: cytochrome c [Proteobacteria bacterium]|nr:cytochrome c [Pseudomonadota bacterium]
MLALLLVLTMGAGSPARADGDRVKGEALAKRICALCHVIGDHNRMGGIDSTPSFPLMAKRPDIFAHRIPTFQQRRPHPQFQWSISIQDIADLESYIQSLSVKK